MEKVVKEKYYIPEFEEFYPGFECEWLCSFPEFPIQEEKKDNSIPEYRRITVGLDFEFTQLPERLKYDNYRVKYLDKEDIESLGWKNSELTSMELYIFPTPKTSFIEITLEKYNNTLIIEKDGFTLFEGTIKNKSELKKLMSQLGI